MELFVQGMAIDRFPPMSSSISLRRTDTTRSRALRWSQVYQVCQIIIILKPFKGHDFQGDSTPTRSGLHTKQQGK